MVDNLYAEKPPGVCQPLGDFNVFHAGLEIAGRMVVRHEYRVGPVPYSLAEYVSRMDRRPADGPLRDVYWLAERP